MSNTVLVDGDCKDCHTYALTCSAEGKATTCMANYFVNSSNECEKCTIAYSLCSKADSMNSCMTGYYKKVDGTTESCVACNSATNFVRQCKDDPATVTNIIECNEPSTSKYYYLTSEGCKEHD